MVAFAFAFACGACTCRLGGGTGRPALRLPFMGSVARPLYTPSHNEHRLINAPTRVPLLQQLRRDNEQRGAEE